MDESKELELIRKERHKENLEREFKMFTEQLPDVNKRLEIHTKTVELLKKNQEIAINNFVYNEPKWSYESIPEYIENIRQLNILNFEKAQIDWRIQETQMRNQIESINKQIEVATKELERVSAEIDVLKGDGNGK